MIGPARSTRSLSGLRSISSRPVFIVVLTPSMPTTEEMLATAGSCSSASTSASCRRCMAANEMSCGATVVAWISPVSCTGKKPLGMTM
ncbi:hypothetical protein GALL_420300 [mine drainage metagenome]|uniref:Uncharacterized protein n=1 Tax=mine drainage metagenome TaxID=410659 RepID=A0A1J5PZA0_9ZZZZ